MKVSVVDVGDMRVELCHGGSENRFSVFCGEKAAETTGGGTFSSIRESQLVDFPRIKIVTKRAWQHHEAAPGFTGVAKNSRTNPQLRHRAGVLRGRSFLGNNALSAICHHSSSQRTQPHHHKHPNAAVTTPSLKLTGVTARVSAKVARRALKVALRASVDDEAVTFTRMTSPRASRLPTPPGRRRPPSHRGTRRFLHHHRPRRRLRRRAAPLGDDMSMLNDAMIAFKEPRAVEIINGRVAMIGWMAALYAEISNDQSLTERVINTRTFTLADGVVILPCPPRRHVPIPVTVLAVLAAPGVLRGNEESGLEKAPKDFGLQGGVGDDQRPRRHGQPGASPRREVHPRRGALLSGCGTPTLRELSAHRSFDASTDTDAVRTRRIYAYARCCF